MPTISAFYGILIRMYFDDHSPAHFHARYGDVEVTIAIETLKVIRGELPSRAMGLVIEWATIHKEELLDNWRRCRDKQHPGRIEPLA